MPAKTIAILHDAIGRYELLRQSVATQQRCDWCGNKRRASNRLFRYGVQMDGIATRTEWLRGLFCSVSCWRAYYNA